MNLANKTVVITGASRGLGKELARVFAKRKAKLILGARSKNGLEELAEEINAIFLVTDVSIEKDVKELANIAVKKFGKIDIWINNAGVRVWRTSIEDVDIKKFHDMIEINLFGTFYGSREALKQMKKQKTGTIVNILSTSALKGKAMSSAYGASKMAVVGFTKTLRNEAGDADIKVIGVYLGGLKTNFNQGQVPKEYDTFLEPEDVAEKIVANLELDVPNEELTILKI